MVNPIIKNKSLENSIYSEGCLSVPSQFIEIDRPSTCEVEYLDYNGNRKILNASGLLAICIQHEIDHLDGKLFVDYLSALKQSRLKKRIQKKESVMI